MLKYLILFSPNLLFAQAWVKLQDFTGSKRDDGVAVVIAGKAYVGTGVDPSSATIDFKVLDLNSYVWSSISNMPLGSERQYACAFATDTCFFISCGLGATGALTSTYRYSLPHQNWRQVSPKPNAGLMSAACFQFGTKVILAGGKGNNDVINHEVWEYDLAADTWQQKNNLPFSPTWRGAYCSLNGYGYVLGGVDSLSRFSRRMYQYAPGSDQWTLLDSLPVPRGRAYQAMQGINNRLFVFGGFDSLNTYYNDAFIYNTQLSQWLAVPAMPAEARKGGMSVGYGQHFFYTCGILANGDRQTETWMTDVPTEIFETSTDEKITLCYDSQTELLKLSTAPEKILGLDIFNLQGKKMKSLIENDVRVQVSVVDLEKGIYFLKVKLLDGEILTEKFFRN